MRLIEVKNYGGTGTYFINPEHVMATMSGDHGTEFHMVSGEQFISDTPLAEAVELLTKSDHDRVYRPPTYATNKLKGEGK